MHSEGSKGFCLSTNYLYFQMRRRDESMSSHSHRLISLSPSFLLLLLLWLAYISSLSLYYHYAEWSQAEVKAKVGRGTETEGMNGVATLPLQSETEKNRVLISSAWHLDLFPYQADPGKRLPFLTDRWNSTGYRTITSWELSQSLLLRPTGEIRVWAYKKVFTSVPSPRNGIGHYPITWSL
jgi:hypothetical protein